MISKKQLSFLDRNDLSAGAMKDFLHHGSESDEVPLQENELPDKSLFDHLVDAKYQGDLSTVHALIHRTVIISRMVHKDLQEIGQYFEKLFKDIQSHLQCEAVSGLFLLYPSLAIHVVECSQDMLMELLRELEDGGHVNKSQILAVSYDISQRQYQQWSFRVLDIEAPSVEDYETTEECDKLVGEILTQLLKLGAHLSNLPKATLKNSMDSLHQKVPELLPQQLVIAYLLDSDEPCVIKPSDYMKRQQRPFDVMLQSELVWPMAVRLFPYQ